jgi:hypothetical protein
MISWFRVSFYTFIGLVFAGFVFFSTIFLGLSIFVGFSSLEGAFYRGLF